MIATLSLSYFCCYWARNVCVYLELLLNVRFIRVCVCMCACINISCVHLCGYVHLCTYVKEANIDVGRLSSSLLRVMTLMAPEVCLGK